MTTKIEITITENDDVYFIYVYKEKALLHKIQIQKDNNTLGYLQFITNTCHLVGETVTRIIKGVLKGE